MVARFFHDERTRETQYHCKKNVKREDAFVASFFVTKDDRKERMTKIVKLFDNICKTMRATKTIDLRTKKILSRVVTKHPGDEDAQMNDPLVKRYCLESAIASNRLSVDRKKIIMCIQKFDGLDDQLQHYISMQEKKTTQWNERQAAWEAARVAKEAKEKKKAKRHKEAREAREKRNDKWNKRILARDERVRLEIKNRAFARFWHKTDRQ